MGSNLLVFADQACNACLLQAVNMFDDAVHIVLTTCTGCDAITCSSRFSIMSTTGSRFAASFGKNFTTTL